MTPILEKVPDLPQPDWSAIGNPQDDGYQSQNAMEEQISGLTENLQ